MKIRFLLVLEPYGWRQRSAAQAQAAAPAGNGASGSCLSYNSRRRRSALKTPATRPASISSTASVRASLGSLLEGTGAGCIWFDYNNDGLPDLYVVNGRPLDDSMHPYPLKDKPVPPPHNHLYRNDGNGHFTDVTAKAGLNPDMYSVAVTAADYDNDGFVDLLVTGYGKTILYHNDGNGHFTDVTEKAGIKVDGWAISSTWLDYDKDGCVDLFVGRYVKFDPKYRELLRCRQLSRPARLRRRDQQALSQQLRRHVYRCHARSRASALLWAAPWA